MVKHAKQPDSSSRSNSLGSLLNISARNVVNAGKLVKTGLVFRLSHELHADMPYRPTHGSFFYSITLRPQDYHEPFRPASKNGFGASIGRMELSDHAGTHLDSLNHISKDGKYFGGIDAIQSTGPRGTSHLGVETTPPIVTRGILINVCKSRGVDMVESGPIFIKDVEKELKDSNISPEPGDAVLFYTGISKLWSDPQKFMGFYEKAPGIGMELSRWIVEKKLSIAGVDTPGSEVSPPENPGFMLPVHQFLIAESGVRLIDNMNLAGIADAGLAAFMFICSPLPIKGATASPVSPLAII